ncbi:hypothetical protein BGZ54_009654 [Gamsiella multidivaricata]|nr:hypothetical protein BGZ54_009654 [Gamsiella multidivaricata]
MTSATLRTITFVLALCATAQGVPLPQESTDSFPTGDAYNQSGNSGSVQLGSSVNMIPITNVTPINRYQPIVQAFAPLVQSQCQGDFSGLTGPAAAILDSPGTGAFPGTGTPNGFPDASAPGGFPGGPGAGGPMRKRQLSTAAGCAAAQGTTECNISLPSSTVDLGSQVNILPSTAVTPSTTFAPEVASFGSNIQAAPASSSMLPPQNVNLGSNVAIQPTTQVLPQTTYQPAVHQLTTAVQAAPEQDQTLPQSSVQLGSSVQIVPTVSVQPLTIYQPTVQSLPFVIDIAPCADQVSPQPAGLGLGVGMGLDAAVGQCAPLMGGAFAQDLGASGQGILTQGALGQGIPSMGTLGQGIPPMGALSQGIPPRGASGLGMGVH